MPYNNNFYTMTSFKKLPQPTNCALNLHTSCTKKNTT